MTLFQPPSFCRSYACIADDAALAGQFSSMVGNDGEYVSVLEGPRMRRPDNDREIIRRCNGAAKVWPRSLLLTGLEAAAAFEIERLLQPQVSIVRVRDVDQMSAAVPPAQRRQLVGEICCRLADIGPALLKAKRQRKILRVDDSAPTFDAGETIGSPLAVVVDDHSPMAQVIAANYAFSIGADLLLIPERDDHLRDDVYSQIDARGAFLGEDRGTRAQVRLNNLRGTLEPSLQFGRREFVTFITRGIPYGYFYRDAPSTHLFSYPCLGEAINAGVYWATVEPFLSAAVLIDPGHFASSETSAVSASLRADGVTVFEVLNDQANVENTKLFFQVFPYDLLFICSHCGEVGGQRLTVRVPDATGTMHEVEIDEVVQVGSMHFSSQPGKLVQIHQLLRPVAIDGADWHSAGLAMRHHYEAIWAFFLTIRRDKWEILREEEVKHVPHSTAIQLKQGSLLLNLQQAIDPSVSPVIFNNGCVSFYDAAQTLTFAGARAYVGTLTPVKTTAAQRLAEIVFADNRRSTSLPLVLAEAQSQVFPDPDDRTYVHVGCHFEAIRPSPSPSAPMVQKRIRTALAHWQSKLGMVDGRMRENIIEFTRFLSVFN